MRRTLSTRYPLLTDRQRHRLTAVFADDSRLTVELCWSFYQRMIAAHAHHAHHDRRAGKTMMTAIIDTVRSGVPDELEELAQLGRTLHRRRTEASGLSCRR